MEGAHAKENLTGRSARKWSHRVLQPVVSFESTVATVSDAASGHLAGS